MSESQLIGLSHEKFQQWEQSNLDSIAGMFDERAIVFWANGKSQTKIEMFKLYREGKMSIKNLRLEHTFARVYGNTGVVHGEGEALITLEGEELSGDLRFLDVWVERENGWKIVSSHFNQVV
ncbi:nuclear transport factor 2 family protein [Algoriphagus sp.]|uniref:nuclear transport factor 2 family protein n=1 Tax=Algoriphagus sp. TaxID=1872435 RepID=UPI00391AA5E4